MVRCGCVLCIPVHFCVVIVSLNNAVRDAITIFIYKSQFLWYCDCVLSCTPLFVISVSRIAGCCCAFVSTFLVYQVRVTQHGDDTNESNYTNTSRRYG